MTGVPRTRRRVPRRDLLDDESVGGALVRIRALASLVAIAARDADPTAVATVAWLVEGLAADALDRLRAVAHRRTPGRPRP